MMIDHYRELTPYFSVSGQITLAEVEVLKDLGVQAIINNRPDGEAPDQTPSDQLYKLCQAQGLHYAYCPVSPAGIDPHIVAQQKDFMRGIGGKTHAFCRTGNRSTRVWQAIQNSGEP
jgi:uncharacterized protein (TIGR01244 family)